MGVSASVRGLSPNTTYHFRIVASNAAGPSVGGDQTLKTPPFPPLVVTGPASSLTQTSATLNATVFANGATIESCQFDYGLTTAYGISVPCATPIAAVEASAAVVGLAAATTYHFRAVVSTPGATSHGVDQTFTTPPVAAPPVTKPPVMTSTPPAQGVLPFQEHGGAKTAGVPSVLKAQTGARSVMVTVECKGTSSQTCDGDASLYGTEHRLANKIVSLSSKRSRTVMVLVGHLHFTVHGGQTPTLTLPLNSTGRALLRHFGRLPIKLVVTLKKATGGKLIVIGKGTIAPPHKH